MNVLQAFSIRNNYVIEYLEYIEYIEVANQGLVDIFALDLGMALIILVVVGVVTVVQNLMYQHVGSPSGIHVKCHLF